MELGNLCIGGLYMSQNSPQINHGADSVDQFCADHNIAKGTFYNLMKEGNGPDTFNVGRRRLISKEAAARWRQKMEQQTAQAACS
jgi:hypothetical protein